MSSSEKLEPIAKIRKQQERNAGRLHGETLREAEKQQQQLDELINYRDQYAQNFKSASESGLSAIQLQEYRIFLTRLDDAVMQQKQFVINGQNKCEVSQKEWMSKRSKSKIIERAVENRELVESEKKERIEQKELEDRPHQIQHNS